MLSTEPLIKKNSKNVCVIDKEYMTDKVTTFKIVNTKKISFKDKYVVNNIYDQPVYYFESNKFCDAKMNPLFEYKLKLGIMKTKIIIQNDEEHPIKIKSHGISSFQVEFFNQSTNQNEIFYIKESFMGNTITIYNGDMKDSRTSIVGEVEKKKNIFNPTYEIEIKDGIDATFIILVVYALIRIRTRNIAAGSSASC